MRALVGWAFVVAACGAAQTPGAAPVLVPPQPREDAGAPSLPVAVAKPVAAPFLRDVVSISVGQAHVCALTASHEVVCWGDNAAGQLGVGKDGRSVGPSLSRPHVVGGLPPIAS